jgi:hypothetical protein
VSLIFGAAAMSVVGCATPILVYFVMLTKNVDCGIRKAEVIVI